MARITPRTTRSAGSNSDARQSATAPPPPPPKKPVFVIDDDSDDDDTEEEGGGGEGEVRHRVNVRNRWPSELQKDRQSNGDSSSETSSGSRSDSSIRPVSDQETGSDSFEISEEERGEECGSKSSPEPSVRLVELDSSDDEEGETSNCCSLIEKSKSLEIPEEVRVKEEVEEEVDENEVKPMAKLLPFCVARRTRAQIGKINRVSYSEYFKEKSSDDSEDEEDTEVEESEKDEPCGYAEKSESVSVLGGSSEDNEVFVKKKKLGIDILVSVSNEGGDSEGVNSSIGSEGVSQRTRSRFNSVVDPKMKKMGTVRNPVCLDVDELQSEEDEMEDDGIGMDLDRGKGKWVCNRNKGGSGMNTKVSNGVRDGNRMRMQDTDISKDLVERKRKWVDSATEHAGRMGTQVSNMMESERREGSNGIKLNVDAREKKETDGDPASTSKKRKQVRPPNANELFKILANNIFNEEGTTLDELLKKGPPVEDNSAACQENLLPFVFSFGDDDEKPVEKAEHEKELDDLWADFDFATEANNIGVYHDDEVQFKFFWIGISDYQFEIICVFEWINFRFSSVYRSMCLYCLVSEFYIAGS